MQRNFLSKHAAFLRRGQNGAVRAATPLQAGRSGFRTQLGKGEFLFSISVKSGPGAHSASFTTGTGALSLG